MSKEEHNNIESKTNPNPNLNSNSNSNSNSIIQNQQQQTKDEVTHRQTVSKIIYSIWSNNGSDLSGLACPFLDGRVDILGSYVMMLCIGETTTTTTMQKLVNSKVQQEYEQQEKKEDLKMYDQTKSEGKLKTTSSIPRISSKNLTYQHFFQNYMEPNKPIIIQGLALNWKAMKDWVQQPLKTTNCSYHNNNNDNGDGDGDGDDCRYKQQQKQQLATPNLETLERLFGHEIAPVHVQTKGGFTLTRPKKNEMTVKEYIQWWKNHKKKPLSSSPDVITTATATTPNNNNDSYLYYLKDWKFASNHPEYDLYNCPTYFKDDWLNQVTDQKYQFVYLGPKGTSTRLHSDVLFSYSWSTNVCGMKRWYLIPPEYTYLLKDCFGKDFAPHLFFDDNDDDDDINDDDNESDSPKNQLHGEAVFYPGLSKAREYAIKVIQYPGETIFVPSGWYHTVENLQDTLSINHNWINGTNIQWSWHKLKQEMDVTMAMMMKQSNIKRRDDNPQMNTPMNDKDIAANVDVNGVGQIEDDLKLLWKLITTNITEILQTKNSNSSSKDTTDMESFLVTIFMRQYNLKAILPILEWMDEIVSEGRDFGIVKRSNVRNPRVLIEKVQEYLMHDEVVINSDTS